MHVSKFVLASSSLVLAACLWVLIFLVRPLNFWAMMSLSTFLLLLVAAAINRERISVKLDSRFAVLGLLSAAFLYGLFYFGFPLTKGNPIFGESVARVYDLRSALPTYIIGLLLTFPIAPSEEAYWRGLIQRRLAEKLGVRTGFLLATVAYSLVHLPTLNPPLILTALIGGFVWGYVYVATGSLFPGIISHVTFDLLIFVIAPLG